ncbi:hypothetical protein H4R20_003520, partial [Coemansia guatemalensis]
LVIGDQSLEEPASDVDGGHMSAIIVQIALQLWAEFQNWIMTTLLTVYVRYSNARICDNVQMQLVQLTTEPNSNVFKVSDGDQRAVSLQLGHIASSIIKCPVKQLPAMPLQTDSKSEDNSNTVDIATAELLEILAMLYDGSVVQKTAFAAINTW